MKKSARVTVTVVAAMGFAVRAHSQDPCDAASFNPKACQVAVKRAGFCSGGAWVTTTYQQSYPDYYDAYLNYLNQGGMSIPVPEEKCGSGGHTFFASVFHGGFGSTGASHSGGGHSGC